MPFCNDQNNQHYSIAAHICRVVLLGAASVRDEEAHKAMFGQMPVT